MDTKTSTLAMIDSAIQGMLWSVLCFGIIRYFGLEDVWYLVCAGVLLIEIGLSVLHQRITFPGLIVYLGYELNDKVQEMKKFYIKDHIINIVIMFMVVYLCISR